MFQKARLSKNRVLVFGDDNTITDQAVVDQNSECVETKNGIYHIEDCKTFIDAEKGGVVYIINAPQPAQVEAENLKKLRRSTALKRVFEFDRSTGEFQWGKIMPWVVIVLLVLFK